MTHHKIILKEMKFLHFLFECFYFYGRFVYVGSVLFWCFRCQLEQLYYCRSGLSIVNIIGYDQGTNLRYLIYMCIVQASTASTKHVFMVSFLSEMNYYATLAGLFFQSKN